MPCINFSPSFVPKIISGSKVHTIRVIGARPHRVGETLYMQYGKRFKPLRFMTTTATRVRPIDLGHACVRVWTEDRSQCVFPLLDPFAQADGFDDWQDLRRFFNWKRLINAQLIQWAPAPWEVEAAHA